MKRIKPQHGRILENEILLKEGGDWLHFADPHQLIFADALDDVQPALQAIEKQVQLHNWHAAGFLSYEAAAAFDPAFRTNNSDFPYLWFGLYPEPRRVSLPAPQKVKEILDWQPAIRRESYDTAIDHIKQQIAQGRTYQVNYTMRLESDFVGDSWNFFLHLAQHQDRYAAYVDTGRYAICSASPELFFHLDGGHITCRPMKGTTGRGRTTREDQECSEWLRNSEKNRAENVMIVDMIRNDLGRIAKTGSVSVPELFKTERYPTLWQMTSTVTARTDASLLEIFRALFPCASITGAPKVRTMQIITELENTPRKIYTGAIGYLAPQRRARFNVAIRTALIDRKSQRAEYGVGGGIVWDSSSMDEYTEALLKARVLTQSPGSLSLLETMLWTPEEGFFLYEKHLARMLDSAEYFQIPVTKETLEAYLIQISARFESPGRVRLLLDQSGGLSVNCLLFENEANPEPLRACLAKEPVDSKDVFLYHKTTQRARYEAARERGEGYDDVLLYNEAGELTEFTIGNLVVEIEGRFFTPPISCGVLPGTFRAHLLEAGHLLERTVLVEELKDCERIFRINSIRKWQEVKLVMEHQKAL
jgi:para-aminobenzoate synthetase/4-amino-4-deoxychorismate lyase